MNLAAAPEIIADCPYCGGDGHTLHRISVYEHGCGFPHDDVEARHCTDCHGVGFSIEEAEGHFPASTPLNALTHVFSELETFAS
jgi:hypothetical protein